MISAPVSCGFYLTQGGADFLLLVQIAVYFTKLLERQKEKKNNFKCSNLFFSLSYQNKLQTGKAKWRERQGAGRSIKQSEKKKTSQRHTQKNNKPGNMRDIFISQRVIIITRKNGKSIG
jgi:hypothetical protein